MLSLVGLSREKTYTSATSSSAARPRNRDPLNTEQDACIDFLRGQVALLRPKIIVCLGRVAANRLIHDDYKITKEHGKWEEKAGVYMTGIYHPAALLRDPYKKPDTFVDLKAIQEKIRQVCRHTVLLSPIPPANGIIKNRSVSQENGAVLLIGSAGAFFCRQPDRCP